MLNATIAGNIGADAVTRVAGQTTVTGFNVAVEQRGKDGKKTQWVGCSMWGKRGETLAQYLTKGGKVCASGELTTREHDGKTYVELNVSELTLMGGAPGGNSGGDAGFSGQGGHQERSPQERKALDDEIPF
jgi:single-strand DNA-binding protein